MVIFEGTPGRVIRMTDPALPATLKPIASLNPSISFAQERSIINRITIAQQTNHQFLHTLGNDIFIYVFGDRMGQVTLSGISASEECNGDTEYGLEKMLRWYKENKLSSRPEPVRIVVGSVTLTGFVTGMSNDLVDPKTWLVNFAVTIALVPEKG